jgi:hypothetical protein
MVHIEARLGLLNRDSRLAVLRNPTKVKNAINYLLKRSIFPLNHKVVSRHAIDCNKLVLATHNLDLNVQRITGVDRRAAGIFLGKKTHTGGSRGTGGSGRGRHLHALDPGCRGPSPYSIAGEAGPCMGCRARGRAARPDSSAGSLFAGHAYPAVQPALAASLCKPPAFLHIFMLQAWATTYSAAFPSLTALALLTQVRWVSTERNMKKIRPGAWIRESSWILSSGGTSQLALGLRSQGSDSSSRKCAALATHHVPRCSKVQRCLVLACTSVEAVSH